MSLVYYECLQTDKVNSEESREMYKKLSLYMLKAIEFVLPYVRKKIENKIYYFVYAGKYTLNLDWFLGSSNFSKDEPLRQQVGSF